MDAEEQARRARRARELVETLEADDVDAVALTWVDNSGITRAKSVPIGRLEQAAAWGVGMSPVFDVHLLNDAVTTSEFVGGPDGDLRLIPDLSRLIPLAAQPGWAWAPVDRYTQEGHIYLACQRAFARRMMVRARQRGFDFRMAFEIEWFLGTRVRRIGPAGRRGTGFRDEPAGGAVRVRAGPARRSRRCRASRCSSSIRSTRPASWRSPAPPRIRSRPPTSPSWYARPSARCRSGTVPGLLRAGRAAPGMSATAGTCTPACGRAGATCSPAGPGPYGMTAEAESFLAGVLRELPALLAVGAPSAASYLRLVPSRWAGAYQCWGRENREAAIRLITGMAGSGASAPTSRSSAST